MTSKIIEAAREAGWHEMIVGNLTGADMKRLSAFYAIAHQQGMEHLASEAIDTVARHGGSVEIEAAIRALPSQQDHFADANKMVDRHTLQAQGKHPAPCARFCEANAFRIEERQQARLIAELEAQVTALTLETERTARNRDMWKGQTQRQADRLQALHSCMAALKRLLARDPCAHASTAVQMIDAANAPQPNSQAEGEPPCSPT